MSTAAVQELVDRVKQLPEKERELFDELLVQLEEEEWESESGKARRLAATRVSIRKPSIEQWLTFAMVREGFL